MELSAESWREMKAALREVLVEELGLGRYDIARKWEGGKMILKPADSAMQSKEIPMEMFFKLHWYKLLFISVPMQPCRWNPH